MGFDEILNVFMPKNALSIEDVKKYMNIPKTKDSKTHLLQGIKLSKMREGFDDNNKKFVNMTKKEKKVLTKIDDKYNRAVSDYANSYKTYLEEHKRLTDSVEDCRADCLSKIRNTATDYVNRRKACLAGCMLKNVQVLKCKDTYKGHKVSGKKCAKLIGEHCTDGVVNQGATSQKFVTSADNVDNYSTTPAEGCCECGGGGGGKPVADINGQKVKSCNDMDVAFGGSKGDGTASKYKPDCNNAGNGVSGFNPTANANFHQEYDKIKGKNNDVMKQAKILRDKISTLIKTRNKIQGTIGSEEDLLDQNLKKFEERYAELQSYGEGGKDYTADAQFHSTMTRKSSEELKFYMWSILAIVLITTVVMNFNKKIN